MARVFLSHTADDKSVVCHVAKHIRNAGHTYWLDEAELRPGESLITKIGQALKHSEYIAAFLSARSADSSWVTKELSIAMTQEIGGRRVRVLPIRLDDADLPEYLIDKYYVDLRNEERWNKEIGKLLCTIDAQYWLHPEKMSYYDAYELAESSDFWRLPTVREAKELRKTLRNDNCEATALWTSTWEDQSLSYVIDYKNGKRIACHAIDHFGTINAAFVRRT